MFFDLFDMRRSSGFRTHRIVSSVMQNRALSHRFTCRNQHLSRIFTYQFAPFRPPPTWWISQGMRTTASSPGSGELRFIECRLVELLVHPDPLMGNLKKVGTLSPLVHSYSIFSLCTHFSVSLQRTEELELIHQTLITWNVHLLVVSKQIRSQDFLLLLYCVL